jgi:hypothetical protein
VGIGEWGLLSTVEDFFFLVASLSRRRRIMRVTFDYMILMRC